MSLEMGYCFLNTEKFPIKGFLEGLKSPTDILTKSKSFLASMLTGPDVKVKP